ncbi:ABC transporter ATP-binding protein [Rhizobium sp. SG570]|uniref:ABC transporter ATP-binding protein n=1 Tax=Rhizobium sp. SG570 TaxID=2587113 RepID=UPI001445B41D|nr:ABC transporter ATP-binding protein [Rhizobium sp. SG570]NKJ40278.1 NitT/TauT family transport system ATP-binding protein [Rhizobium sp. SG570]
MLVKPTGEIFPSIEQALSDSIAALTAIEISDVSMSFAGKRAAVDALVDINLRIPENRFISIIGRSGCGKSTLLRIISNLIPPTRGEVRVHGLSSIEYQRRKKFGFVFQDASLFAWKTVFQNVELPLAILGSGSPAERKEKVLDLLNLVHLDAFADHYPAQLSGGMRQRVSIARALSYEPDILLMDEPFGALDDFTRHEMHDELIRIWKTRGLTVVFVTHSLSEALYLSDQIVVMAPRPGRVKSIVPVLNPRVSNPALRASPDYVRQMQELEALIHEQ